MDNTESFADITSLDALRENIEQECRFKTVRRGFDKSSVQSYISQITVLYEEKTASMEQELAELRAAKQELCDALGQREQTEAEIRADERRRIDAEIEIREGLVSRLRSEKLELEEENKRLRLEIADTKARLSQSRDSLSSGGAELALLGESLSGLLNTRFGEIGDILTAWQKEYSDTIKAVEDRVSKAAGQEI